MDGADQSKPSGDDADAAFPATPGVADVESSVIDRIPLTLRVVLGSVSMPISDVSRLAPGSLVRLDRLLGQPVDLLVNDRFMARGEVGVTADDPARFVLKITELAGGRSDRCGR